MVVTRGCCWITGRAFKILWAVDGVCSSMTRVASEYFICKHLKSKHVSMLFASSSVTTDESIYIFQRPLTNITNFYVGSFAENDNRRFYHFSAKLSNGMFCTFWFPVFDVFFSIVIVIYHIFQILNLFGINLCLLQSIIKVTIISRCKPRKIHSRSRSSSWIDV